MVTRNGSLKTLLTLAVVGASLVAATSASAAEVALSFTKLSGETGGNPDNTAVYRASLSGLELQEILSITIRDSNSKDGGASGRFSGYDLDAIKISSSSVNSADAAAALAGLNLFDFTPVSTIFAKGTQRPFVNPKLFGTDATGEKVDNLVATLGLFDANSTTDITPPGPVADGFVSMGDGGILSFNLTSALDVSSATYYLYVGEVGNNGETLKGSFIVSDREVPGGEDPTVPEPATLSIFGLAGGALLLRRRSNKTA